MLSAEAYSFRQKSRLAISLSWIAGYTNVVVFIVTSHVVSHITGNTTFLGKSIGFHEWPRIAYFAFLLATFFAGAISSAVMTESARRLGYRSKYILPVTVQVLSLTALALIMQFAAGVTPYGIGTVPESAWASFLITGVASFAMGLQNATITRISGNVVRTTHLTGVVTDLAIEGVQLLFWYKDQIAADRARRVGRVLRISQRSPTLLRVLLLASIFVSFFFGVFTGTLATIYLPVYVMIPPLAFLCWIIFIDWYKPIADVRELDIVSDPELKMLGIVKSILPAELGIFRLTFRHDNPEHRPPNFQTWVDTLPAHWRVVIMAVSPLTKFDANSAIDLGTAASRLSADGRRLIVAGITRAQFEVLDRAGAVTAIDADNVCPDMEFAIARGISMVGDERR